MLNLRKKFQNKKILIYGFGKTGKSCFNFLKKNKLTIYDDNLRVIPKNIKQKYFLNLKKIKEQNFVNISYKNLSGGIVAIHSAWKV